VKEHPITMSEPYPGIRQAISLLIVTALLSMVCRIPLILLGTIVDLPLMTHPLALGIANLAAIALVLMWGLGKVGATFYQVYPLTPVAQPLILPICLTVIGVGIILSELDNLLRLVMPVPASFASQFADLMTGDSLFESLLLAIVIAPVTEELLFRGLILQGFLRRYSPRKAILASALLFAAFHGNPWQFLGALVLGVLFACWFLQTRSLIPCILGHAVNNAVPLVLIGVLDIEIEGFTSSPAAAVEFQPAWLNLVGLLCAGWGLSRLVQAFATTGGDSEPGDTG